MKATCVVCGAEFVKLSNNVKTCGEGCRAENTRRYMRDFCARPEQRQKGLERSRRRLAERPAVMANCLVCGKEFRKIRKQLTCSKACGQAWRDGRWQRERPEFVQGVSRKMIQAGAEIEPFPADADRDAFGYWLSGFADGESSFMLRSYENDGGRPPRFVAMFRITLRADDVAVLRKIRSYWACGTLYFNDNKRSAIANAKPIWAYGVQKAADLSGIVVPHFDRFPLMSKKRGDFDVWRKGVELLAEVRTRPLAYRPGSKPHRHGGTFPKWSDAERERFRALSDRLKQQRCYADPINDY